MRLLFAVALLLQTAAPHPPMRPRFDLPLQRFVVDMRTKNIVDVLAMYTPDAVFVDPGGKQFATPQDLHQLYEQVFATYDSELEFNTSSMSINTLANSNNKKLVQSGDYSENLRNRATKVTQHLCGGYHFTWFQKPDGRWLIHRMEWTSTPCKGPKVN